MSYPEIDGRRGAGETVLICHGCGRENPESLRLCAGCRRSLAAAAAAANPDQAQLRRLSVMFADVVGSTALVARRHAEEGSELMAQATGTMDAVARAFGGTVLRHFGDSTLVVFGYPDAREDHALQACRAALAMCSEFEMRHPSREDSLRIRVGIHAGEVLMRLVTTDFHREFTPDGATTHIAAKLQQSAPPGGVRISAEILRLVRGQVVVGSPTRLTLAGLADPVEAYELQALGTPSDRFRSGAVDGRSGFVGRVRELALLEQAAQGAAAGQGRAVGVVGEAGLGKSRLLWEFRQRQDGWVRCAASATQFGVSSPFLAIRTLLQGLFELAPEDDADRLARKIRHGVGDAEVDLTPILQLLERVARHVSGSAEDALRRRDRTRRAVVEMLLAAARHRRLLLLIEDLHAADDETLDLVDHLVGRLSGVALLLLLEYRPGPELALERRPAFVRLALPPLTAFEVGQLVRDRIGSDPSLERIQRHLVDRVAGNPFFVEESMRMLGESGAIVGEPGRYRLGSSQVPQAIPVSVADVLETRIAHLPDHPRRVLQVAAALGFQVFHPLLAFLTGQSDNKLNETLQFLVQAGLMQVGSDAARSVAFRHAYTQEVAYGSLLKRDRQQIHSRVVDWLESERRHALADRAELLAHHAVRAELWPRAISYLRLAARRALDRAALREAVRSLDEALRIIAQVSADERPEHCAIDLRLELRTPLVALGRMKRVSEELELAEAEARSCDDPARQCRVLVCLTGHRWLMGRPEAAVEAGRRALALAGSAADPALAVPAREYVGGALHALGRHPEAQAVLSANVEALPEREPGGLFGMAGLPAVLSRATRCWSREHVGDFAGAAADAAAALRIARASGHGFSIQAACFAAGNLHLARGEFDAAGAVIEEGLAVAERERGLWLAVLGPLLALARSRSSDIAAAKALVDRTAPRPDLPILNTSTRLDIVEVYAAIGRVELAAMHGEAVLQQARERREAVNEAFALHLLGAIALQLDTPDMALAQARQSTALALADSMSMAPLAARCRLGLAEASISAGRLEAAAQLAASAAAAFEAMELPYWSTRAATIEQLAARP